MRWLRWLLVLGIAAAVVFLVIYGFRPQPIPIELAEVRRGPMRVTVEEEGKTRVTDSFVVSFPLAGFAERLPLKVGDTVREGQVLTRLQPLRSPTLDPRSRAEAEARVAAAKAALSEVTERVAIAAADADYWGRELERVRKLQSSGDLPQDRLDHTESQARRAAAVRVAAERAVEVARHELEAAQAVLRYAGTNETSNPGEKIPVVAPAGGRVLKVIRESEGVVNAGEPLAEIANSRSLEVVVELLSPDAVKVSRGTRVIFERWGGSEPLEGLIRLVEPTAFTKISALGVEEQRARVIVDFTSPAAKWARLGDGYRVEAVFILWETGDALQTPASALFRQEDKWAVFTVESGFARRRAIEIGRRNGVTAQVLSGLSEGEKVIAHPDDTIRDGVLVRPR